VGVVIEGRWRSRAEQEERESKMRARGEQEESKRRARGEREDGKRINSTRRAE
jgi:hypothetical protein